MQGEPVYLSKIRLNLSYTLLSMSESRSCIPECSGLEPDQKRSVSKNVCHAFSFFALAAISGSSAARKNQLF